jgi:8-oxo-dGTP pyrophosphatase MutT (NUDIX family)
MRTMLIDEMLHDSKALRGHIHTRLLQHAANNGGGRLNRSKAKRDSAVLVTLANARLTADTAREPCLVFTKRSREVRQPGDLCYPGGGVGTLDAVLAWLQRLPTAPLAKWAAGSSEPNQTIAADKQLPLLLTTSLREAWEEMRLNPLRVTFLGPLPAQRLAMFKHTVHPMVGWISGRKQFKPNWEVERIVCISLRQLMDTGNYGRYRLTWQENVQGPIPKNDYPCFITESNAGREILWGISYRITMQFLAVVFDFNPPETDDLPVIRRYLDSTYFNGNTTRTQ